MVDYIIKNIELTDIQNTISVLDEKLSYWKTNYPYAFLRLHLMC